MQVCGVVYYLDINIKDFPELSYLFLMKIGSYQAIPELGDLPPTYRARMSLVSFVVGSICILLQQFAQQIIKTVYVLVTYLIQDR